MSERGLQLDTMEETGRVIVERSADGHRFVILPGQAYDYIDPDAALAAVREVEPLAVYFGTLAQRGARSREALFALLGASTATRFLDLNLRDGQFDERLRRPFAAGGRHRQGQRRRTAGAVQLVARYRPTPPTR